MQGFRLISFGQQGCFALLAVFIEMRFDAYVHNGLLKDMAVLQEPPFTEQGSIVDIFPDMSVWQGIKAVIRQINTNAGVA